MSGAQRRILVVHPGAELFGSDRMLLESVIGMCEAGHDVTVALPEHGPLIEELEHAGAEVHVMPMLVLRKALLKPSGWLTFLTQSVRGLVAGSRVLKSVSPDAVYVSTITLPQWPLLARARRSRTVTHVHEAETSAPRLVSTALYAPHLASHLTLVNSEFSLKVIRHALPLLARRSRVVYNGVASPSTPTPPRASLDGGLRVLYVGRLSPRKGPDLVIDAAAALQKSGRDVEVTLLGAAFMGYEWFEERLRDQAAEVGVETTFAGFHKDIWPFLATADVLVVPSRLDEPFGNTAVEGVLAERPVIASDSSGLREAAGGYRTARLVPPDDASGFAEALEEIIAEWPAIRTQVEMSRDEAIHRHAPESYRRRIADAMAED